MKYLKEKSISEVKNKLSGFRLQPLYVIKHGFVFAHEMLCDFRNGDSPESNINNLTELELIALFTLQVETAYKRKGRYFINISSSILASKKKC